MNKEEIDQKYLSQHSQLEEEFFTIDETEHKRILKKGKSIDDFNQRHAEIWQNHQAELIAEGFMEAPKPPELTRDLAVEIDKLRAEIELLKSR